LADSRKKVDAKVDAKSLAFNVPDRDVVIYKMHGDISMPGEAVITKEDYELYNEKRGSFSIALQGDLITKTFLFIGFSFEDPNLNYILSRIRVLLGANSRQHYALFKKVSLADCHNNTEEYEYAQTKERLRIDDLKNYAIQAVMIDSYEEIPGILEKIRRRTNIRNVFISGSAAEHTYGAWSEEEAVVFIDKLTKSLIEHEKKIVTGFGLGIGSWIVYSALQTIHGERYSHYDSYLEINPFPFQIPDDQKKEVYNNYRRRVINNCGAMIFIFGNKNVKSMSKKVTNQISDGVIKEFEIAKEKNLAIIPVASTGFAAKQVFDKIKKDRGQYKYLDGFWDVFENSKDTDKIVDAIIIVLDRLEEE
jgi:hypothetical protein